VAINISIRFNFVARNVAAEVRAVGLLDFFVVGFQS
jgi:hypothetical protein